MREPWSLYPTEWQRSLDRAECIGDQKIHALPRSLSGRAATGHGDKGAIEIGARDSILRGTVLHCDPGSRRLIGVVVTIGHAAVVEACQVRDHSLIGIAAMVLNSVRIGHNRSVGANALVI